MMWGYNVIIYLNENVSLLPHFHSYLHVLYVVAETEKKILMCKELPQYYFWWDFFIKLCVCVCVCGGRKKIVSQFSVSYPYHHKKGFVLRVCNEFTFFNKIFKEKEKSLKNLWLKSGRKLFVVTFKKLLKLRNLIKLSKHYTRCQKMHILFEAHTHTY